VENLRRAIEGAVGGDGNKIAQMTKFHSATVAHTKSMSEPKNKALGGFPHQGYFPSVLIE
jgi:hypothetical protein